MKITKKYIAIETKLIKATEINKVNIDLLIKFLKKNNYIVENFNTESTINIVSGCKNPYEMFYKIFLDSINASGGNNLTRIAKGCRTFLKIFEKPEKNNKLNFSNYYYKNNIEDNIKINIENKYIKFFEFISSGVIDSFRKKKAALFMRGLYCLQKEYNIFEDIDNPELIYMPIPVDVVISEIICKLLKMNDIMDLSQEQKFNIINQWANNYFKNDYYLVESIWFWGYFTTRNGNDGRIIGFNDDKYITNNWFFPDYKYIDKYKRFAEIISTGA